VNKEIQVIMADEQRSSRRPTKISVLGQIADMQSAFTNIGIGLAIAVIARLSADGDQLPELGRPVRGPLRPAFGVLRHQS